MLDHHQVVLVMISYDCVVVLLCFDATGLLVCVVPPLHSAEHLNVVIYLFPNWERFLCVFLSTKFSLPYSSLEGALLCATWDLLKYSSPWH